MAFRSLSVKPEYRSLTDNMIRDFYVPLLSESVLYRRAAGFFSSTALANASRGIARLVENGGRMQLIASPYLSDDDVAAMKMGYDNRRAVLETVLLNSLYAPQDYYEEERLNFLANLIAQGRLDIKIAIIEKNSVGMFHEKMGLLYDHQGDIIAFSGSMNESGMAFVKNYEAIDVFCSWTADSNRVSAKEAVFEAAWNNREPGIEVMAFPSVADELFRKYHKNDSPNLRIDEEELQQAECTDAGAAPNGRRYGAVVPEWLSLHDYQQEAISTWAEKGFCGIFDMATGTGKTLTGLGAVALLSEHLSDRLAVFIVCPYQHLVEQWVEDIVQFRVEPIIGYSASVQKNWKQRLADAVRDQKLTVRNRGFFCFVCTNATFSSEFVQSQISKMKGNSLLLIDEAHNFGAENLSRLLNPKFQYRLALSATLERHNDEEGTAALYHYFGEKCIEYTLDRAIEEGKLTRYKYYPRIVTLNESELQEYLYLTQELGKCMMKGKDGKLKMSERGKKFALARARVVAGAEGKIRLLRDLIQPYLEDKHILVYCGAAKLLAGSQDTTSVDEEDMRQIDAVTHLLGNVLNMKVSQFTSKEDIAEREVLKREFSEGANLQVLIAIKCLDEGVNIPRIKTAFILASTTNPKEYIQRRGRVLRLAHGKDFAELYDFITVPRPINEVSSLTVEQLKKEVALVKNELNRAKEFARLSMNIMEAEIVIDSLKQAYGINDNQFTFEEDECYAGD